LYRLRAAASADAPHGQNTRARRASTYKNALPAARGAEIRGAGAGAACAAARNGGVFGQSLISCRLKKCRSNQTTQTPWPNQPKENNCIPSDSYFLPLPFESEGYACNEVGQLLMAWAKIWAHGRDETELAAKKLHHRQGPPVQLTSTYATSNGIAYWANGNCAPCNLQITTAGNFKGISYANVEPTNVTLVFNSDSHTYIWRIKYSRLKQVAIDNAVTYQNSWNRIALPGGATPQDLGHGNGNELATVAARGSGGGNRGSGGGSAWQRRWQRQRERVAARGSGGSGVAAVATALVAAVMATVVPTSTSGKSAAPSFQAMTK
jgi:hypothetical protein